MKSICYFCKKYVKHSYCQFCSCWSMSNSDNVINEVRMKIILNGIKQYTIIMYPVIQKTEIEFNGKIVVNLNSLPLNLSNVKNKLPLYLTFS